MSSLLSQPPLIIALTSSGYALAQRVSAFIDGGEVWYKPQPFSEKIQQAFVAGRPLIFICATGIVVRTLAPVLQHKTQDPPVVVLDEHGEFVIPLLSGHEGGANQWGKTIAGLLNAQLVITSAYRYTQPRYFVGIGCERDCPIEYIDEVLQRSLQQANIGVDNVDGFYSIDIKADEQSIIDCAASYQQSLVTFSVAELTTVEHLLMNSSEYVYQTVGVYGVAESAALFAALAATQKSTAMTAQENQPLVELVVPKQKNTKATCAIARAYLE